MSSKARTVRLDAATIARLDAASLEGESPTATLRRVIAAGLDAVEGRGADAGDDADEDGGGTREALGKALDALEDERARTDQALALVARQQDLMRAQLEAVRRPRLIDRIRRRHDDAD